MKSLQLLIGWHKVEIICKWKLNLFMFKNKWRIMSILWPIFSFVVKFQNSNQQTQGSCTYGCKNGYKSNKQQTKSLFCIDVVSWCRFGQIFFQHVTWKLSYRAWKRETKSSRTSETTSVIMITWYRKLTKKITRIQYQAKWDPHWVL